MLGIGKPRVAVLNIGEEETKGNAQTKATYELLKEDGRINFVGNVEGSYIFTGQVADVIVCDGFVGNTVLKMAEGLYRINKKLGGGNAFWDAMKCARIHSPQHLVGPRDQKHDPFDGAVHQGGPYRQTAACFQKLITQFRRES